jgi:hypothetical protein
MSHFQTAFSTLYYNVYSIQFNIYCFARYIRLFQFETESRALFEVREYGKQMFLLLFINYFPLHFINVFIVKTRTLCRICDTWGFVAMLAVKCLASNRMHLSVVFQSKHDQRRILIL